MDEVGIAVSFLDKAIRQYSLYGPLHPQYLAALKDFDARMREALALHPSLQLNLKRTEVEFNGEAIFKLAKRENNYVQQMFVDGLRQLEFQSAVRQDELHGFISVLGRDVQGYEVREDDTVTLLWKKGFDNIRYQTVDIYSGDRFALLQEMVAEEDLSKEQKDEQSYLERFVARLVEGTVSPVQGAGRPVDHNEEARTELPEDLFTFSESENEALGNACAGLENRDYLKEVLVVFCEVLEQDWPEQVFQELVRSFLSSVRESLAAGAIATAGEWLKRLRGVDAHVSQTNVEAHRIIEAELLAMASPEFFATLGANVAAGVAAPPEDWIRVFTLLGPRAVPAVCELLAHFPQETLHTAISSYLIDQAPDAVDVYMAHLKRSEWVLVRDMIRVLGSVSDDRILASEFRKGLLHPQPEVRREVVRALRRFSSKTAEEMVVRALSDPDASVRDTAVRVAALNRNSAFTKALAAVISKESFIDRSAGEKRRFLAALARCGGLPTLQFLKQVVESAGSSDLHDELRVAALYATTEIQDPAAQTFLKEIAGKLLINPKVRETAKNLLKAPKAPPEDGELG